MTTNHAEPTIITYGSQYGSAEHYARKFAECTGLQGLPYREVKNLSDYMACPAPAKANPFPLRTPPLFE